MRGDVVEAGADLAFTPDHTLRDGDIIEGDGFSIDCLHTPGHCANHVCFQLRETRALFTGDQVMGWSTSVVAPPDGDMGDYLRSLERFMQREDEIYFPTHGAPVTNPKLLVAAYLRHREAREQQIRECLARGVHTIAEMVPSMYVGLAPFLVPAAARSVLAHLLHLLERELVVCDGEVSLGAVYHLR
jgi:glyoxylase-like metal-dependent hydrolase (beta-lactamase superfamily II)